MKEGTRRMKIPARRGGILRIRPGSLANFSGGAGYMPFIVLWSVPVSIVFGLISSVILHFNGPLLSKASEPGDETTEKRELFEFTRYARRHLVVCAVLTVLAGAFLFASGQSMVYGDKLKYAPATFVLTVGPMIAGFLSTLLLVKLISRRGARFTNFLIAAAAHLLLLAACLPVLMLVSAVTGAGI